ncbi:MAG: hypothetical protein IT158_05145 [Bryobacterales bacterium]|nr:hypothetical protein [Bryobacterales bacterium]
MKKLVVMFTLFALSVASAAKTYRVTLFQPSVVAGTELKAGEYKLELVDQKVRISNGKQVSEAPVEVQSAAEKFSSTTVKYVNGDGKYRVQEIRLGGTNTRLVFNN